MKKQKIKFFTEMPENKKEKYTNFKKSSKTRNLRSRI